MSAFSAIDLSQMPAPDLIETLDYEVILAAMKADIIAKEPTLADVLALESEPLTKLLEECAYRELLLRQRVNDAARARMLAYANGTDLEHLASWPYKVERLLIDAGDPDAYPPIEPTYESDSRYRARLQLSPEGYSTAGPDGAYIFHALSADTTVKDVATDSPSFSLDNGSIITDYAANLADPVPGDVAVTVLSTEGDGTPDQALMDLVGTALNEMEVRPLTDRPRIRSAEIITYSVTATIYTYSGPDPETVLAAAQAAIESYTQDNHLLGRDIAESGLHAALHQPGVQRVEMDVVDDIVVEPHQAAYCTAITISHGGIDE